jgi:hypothetical protein
LRGLLGVRVVRRLRLDEGEVAQERIGAHGSVGARVTAGRGGQDHAIAALEVSNRA